MPPKDGRRGFVLGGNPRGSSAQRLGRTAAQHPVATFLGLVIFAVVTASRVAGSPRAIDLAQVAARYDGAEAGERTGAGVANLGDVNGDGVVDFVVAAPWAGNNGRGRSGSVYVVFGPWRETGSNLGELGANGFRIDGAAPGNELGAAIGDFPNGNEFVRTAVAPAGDVNGDGLADLVVGAWSAGNNNRPNSGSAYVVFGKRSSDNVDLNTLGAGGYRIDGATTGDAVGATVAGVGDVNGDGRPDVLVSSRYTDNNGRSDSGSAYVVYGKSSTTSIDLATLTHGFRIDGAVAVDQLGWGVSRAGDVNGDGLQDVAVSSRYSGNNGRQSSGSTYVVFGAASSSNVDLASLGTRGYRIDGAAAGDQIGVSLADAGDVNGDGLADLAIGSIYADNRSGSTYVIFGAASSPPLDLALLSSARGYRISGAGESVANAGDVNADGVPDLIIGSRHASNNWRPDSGSAYVVCGSKSSSTVHLSALGTRGYRIDGAVTGDQAGSSVAGAGDTNGDNQSEVLVGAMTASKNGWFWGSAWLVTTSNSGLNPCSNSPPDAVDDAYTTAKDTALYVDFPGVLANDSDADGDILSATVTTGPAHGFLSLGYDGSFSYTPAAGFTGTDSFTYTVKDDNGVCGYDESSPECTGALVDMATVTITTTAPTTTTTTTAPTTTTTTTAPTTSTSSTTTTTAPTTTRRVVADFDGDSDSDISLLRPANGGWYIKDLGTAFFGLNGDYPVPGDYDGVVGWERAVFRPSNGGWYINLPNHKTVYFGRSGDLPVPADYSGDGKADLAVFRPSNGGWYLNINGQTTTTFFGVSGDIPVPADYTGDGKADLAVFRPSNGRWYRYVPEKPQSPVVVPFGRQGDIPVPADYFADGKADIAVFRPSEGRWHIQDPLTTVALGLSGDVPVPGDYDKDGDADITVFRPSNGRWYRYVPAQPSPVEVPFGLKGDIPLPLPYAVYRSFFVPPL
ncbi:MAG: FG-GAP-like repeat-containing protein [Actinomycetota bacterium]|nr:FG-GAP-like repeat-containing protein [Actinomycetota bacterium]